MHESHSPEPENAPPGGQRRVPLRIRRQDGPDGAPYWEAHDVQWEPNLNITSCLEQVAASATTVEGRPTTPVAYEVACLEEICGSCTMVVNGRVRQGCSTLIDRIWDGKTPITLEPMSKFPVVRDLVVDRARMFEDLKRLRGWVPIDNTYALGPGPRESPAEQEERYALSRCMTCGCCLEACPEYARDGHFIGASAISQVQYFNRHKTGAVESDARLELMEGPGGVSDCGNAQNCVKVCPKEIPLTESIAKVGRATTVHAVKKFFTG